MEGPCKHQPSNGLTHHRPIIDRQKLLADSLGNGVKTCAGAAGEDDAFIVSNLFINQRPIDY